MSVGFSDFMALIIIGLGIAVIIFETKSFLKRRTWRWRWIYVFKGLSALYMSLMFFLAIMGLWGPDGRVDMTVGRIGAVLILTSLILGAIVQYRQEDC